jgi:transcriptional regulator GlxA family with amidase domain
MTSYSAKSVLFVVFPDVKLLDLTGPMQVFADTQHVCDHAYDVRVASLDGGDVVSDTGLPIATVSLSALRGCEFDTLIISGGSGALAASADQRLLDAVWSIAGRSRRIASVCTGAFILAQAGLLAGRRAVTHWQHCDALQSAFQDVTVEPDAIFTRDDGIWTSAGVTAGIDMCLEMVAEDVGRPFALALARSLVCYMVRPGGQSQFSTSLQWQSQSQSGQFDALNAWIMDNLTSRLSVDDLADKMAMSPRNFARLYRKQTGVSPGKAVERLRLEAACQLLEGTNLSLTEVVRSCGFGDDENLRRAMIRSFNVSPGEYRRRFGTSRF